MKFLINPFFYVLLLQSTLLFGLRRHIKNSGRAYLRASFFFTLLLMLMAMPLAGRLLLSSLTVPKSPSSLEPQFIFVLGGSYVPGTMPAEDVLGFESQLRTLHAVELWRQHAMAKIVFAGKENFPLRNTDRGVQLMAELAVQRGVPAEKILLEANSRNTRAHPIEALTLAGVSAQTPITIVTSSWHTKRALQEFRRHFQNVQVDPVQETRSPLGWRDFLPNAHSLSTNTMLLYEWVGIFWYAMLNMVQ